MLPAILPVSQFAMVRLKNTGTVILTSDTVYLKENLDKNLIPPIPGTLESRGCMRAIRRFG